MACILELLSLHKGRILTKEMFLNYLYDGMNEPEPSRSLTSLSAGCARSSLRPLAASTTSRPYGGVATCCAIRQPEGIPRRSRDAWSHMP
jgi:hypothetical protein